MTNRIRELICKAADNIEPSVKKPDIKPLKINNSGGLAKGFRSSNVKVPKIKEPQTPNLRSNTFNLSHSLGRTSEMGGTELFDWSRHVAPFFYKSLFR